MRILHVGEYVKGGVSTYLKELINFQRENDQIEKVYLLISKNSDKDFNLDPKNIIYYVYDRRIKYYIKAPFKINKVINSINPDIIHVHSSFAGFFTRIIYFFKKKNVKIIYCSHGWSFLMDIPKIKKFFYATVEKILSIKTDRIINISKYEYEKSIEMGIPVKKSIVIYNGISESNSKSTLPLLPLVLDNKKINLLFVGRFDKQKGLDTVLTLFSSRKFDNVQLYLIGGQILNDQNLNFPDNVVNLGWIPHEQLDYYYSLCDAVIIPSRWEGFGLVAIEALKNKKPVIASNRGALPEIIKDGVNGYIYEFGDLEELAQIIDNLDKNELKRMGEVGYNIYKSNFDSTIMNKKILEEYTQLYSHK